MANITRDTNKSGGRYGILYELWKRNRLGQ